MTVSLFYAQLLYIYGFRSSDRDLISYIYGLSCSDLDVFCDMLDDIDKE